MSRAVLPLTLLVLLIASPAVALDLEADTTQSGLKPSIGGRWGGYGFRNLDVQGNLNWEACRMDGFGLFGNLDFSNHFYVGLEADYYYASPETMRQGLDRLSFISVASAGYRMLPDFWLSPNVHLGAGAEYSRMTVFGNEETHLMPLGFLGLGGEINVLNFHLGVSIRANAMQLPEYDWSGEGAESGGDAGLALRTEYAGQLLFSVRYTM